MKRRLSCFASGLRLRRASKRNEASAGSFAGSKHYVGKTRLKPGVQLTIDFTRRQGQQEFTAGGELTHIGVLLNRVR